MGGGDHLSLKSRQEGGLVLQEIQVRGGGGLKNDPICQGGVEFFWNSPRINHVFTRQYCWPAVSHRGWGC